MKVHPLRAAALAAALAFGGLLLLPSSAQAAPIAKTFVCPGSSLCNPANLPILAELGVISSGASATTVAVATGGVAGLGAFNTAIGIVGATTVLTAGAAVATGLLTQTGMPTGVKLKTQPGSGSEAGASCPVFVAPAIDPASCSAIPDLFGAGPLSVTGLSAVQTGRSYTVSGHVAGTGPVGQDGSMFVAYADGSQCSIFNHIGFAQNAPVDTDFSFDNSINPCSTSQENGQAREVIWETRGLGGGRPYWYDIGLQSWAAGSVPEGGWHGIIRTTITCTSPTGDRPVVSSVHIDVDSGGDLPVPAATCAVGELATATSIEFQVDGTIDWLPLTTGTAPGSVKSLVTTYPDCFGPGVQPCSMQLQQKAGAGWTTCGTTAQLCPDWVSQAVGDPTAFRCQYGTYTLSIDSCSAFRRPGSVIPNYDFDTSTPKPITDPVPSTVGLPVVDPSTGDPAPVPTEDGEQPTDCFPTGWGAFNPLSWILQPIQCAFIPKSDAFANAGAAMASAWAGTSIAEVLLITAQFSDLHGPTGCDGMPVDISIDWPTHWEIHWTFGDSCPGTPLHDVAGVVSTVLGIGVSIGALYTITRYLGSTIGFGGFKGDKDE